MIRVILALTLMCLAPPAFAQDMASLIAEGGSLSARSVQLFVLITVLSLVPALAIMFTCFPFMVTVLSILRQGIGLQQAPPNMLIVSLALFLTYFVMEPVFAEAWARGIAPLIAEEMPLDQAMPQIIDPFRSFMTERTDPEVAGRFAELRPVQTDGTSLSVLVPSFLLSEVARAFEVGFLVFLPFLLIDLVVAAILMSMGMMMVPPAMVALPFKLAFFVVADGWSLIATALVRSYG